MVERFNCAWAHLGLEQKTEPRYQVTYHTYLASRRYPKHYKHDIECSMLVLQIFAILIRRDHMRKHTRLSPFFHTASDGMLGGAWAQG